MQGALGFGWGELHQHEATAMGVGIFQVIYHAQENGFGLIRGQRWQITFDSKWRIVENNNIAV